MESSASGVARATPAVGPVRLADALGWTSALLGVPMTVTPRRFLRAIGVQDDDRAVAWTVAVGIREYMATVQINAMRQRRIGAWARVAGDAMDMSLLISAYRNKPLDRNRLLGTMGLASGILAADLFTAVQLSRAEGVGVEDGGDSAGEGVEHDTSGSSLRVRTAVTIRRPEEEVRRAFREFEWSAFDPAALEEAGEVRFVPAPGDRGTEVHVDHDPSIRGGGVAATAAKVLGQAPDQKINDDLRRFKALLETGVITASETNPDGFSSARQILHKRPAQPVGKDA